jgi:hypothetical protein
MCVRELTFGCILPGVQPSHPRAATRTNRDGIRAVVEAARHAEVTRLNRPRRGRNAQGGHDGCSGQRVLALAAREADIVALAWPGTTEDAARERTDRLRDTALARFDDLELAAGLIPVGDEHRPCLQGMGLVEQVLTGHALILTPARTMRAATRQCLQRPDEIVAVSRVGAGAAQPTGGRACRSWRCPSPQIAGSGAPPAGVPGATRPSSRNRARRSRGTAPRDRDIGDDRPPELAHEPEHDLICRTQPSSTPPP